MVVSMEEIRKIFNKPIIVHVWTRPTSVNQPTSAHHGGNYNLAVGSTATKSMHIVGSAVDYHIQDVSCDDARKILIPLLPKLNLRMEDKKSSTWIHNDNKSVKKDSERYFPV